MGYLITEMPPERARHRLKGFNPLLSNGLANPFPRLPPPESEGSGVMDSSLCSPCLVVSPYSLPPTRIMPPIVIVANFNLRGRGVPAL